MKTKVLKFAADGNTVVSGHMELTQVETGIYTAHVPSSSKFPSQLVTLVFQVNGVFYAEGDYSEKTITAEIDRIREYYTSLPAAWYAQAEQGAWINLVKIRVLSEIGMDAAPIIAARERYREERRREDEQKKADREEAARLAHEAEVERLHREHTRLKDGEFIRASDFVELLRLNGLKVHPRTMGVINNLADKRSEIAARSIKAGYKVKTDSLNGIWPVIEQLVSVR